MSAEVEDALPGRFCLGKSRHGDYPENLTLSFKGKTVYQLQRFLEEEAEKGGDFFRVRLLVLLAEELRVAIVADIEREHRKALTR
jgi:hypothetical protein